MTGFILWFTGMSGAGKTTLSLLLFNRFREHGRCAELLDGDLLRTTLCKDLGFTKQDRDENVRRVGAIAELLARNGIVAVVATISPYQALRDEIRQSTGCFVEVFVDCPLHVLVLRDTKGLYRKALGGEITEFTGISAPYEKPIRPEITIDSSCENPDKSANTIWRTLETMKLI